MDRRLSELEKAAFETIDGEITLHTVPATPGGFEEPVPCVRLSQLQKDAFTMIDGQVAVRITTKASGGFGGCTTVTEIDDTLFGWDDTGLTNRNFSVNNTGFQWDLALGATTIVALCNNTLVTPLPTTTPGMGTLEVDTITLDGNDIKSATSVDITTANTIKLNYNTTIAMPDLETDHNFVVRLNLILKEEGQDDVIIPELTQTLTYLQPLYVVTLSQPFENFTQSYISVNVTRTFERGGPTSFAETSIGPHPQTAGTPILSSFNYNINTVFADRTMKEEANFINVSNNGAIEKIALKPDPVIMPRFQFPIYLGSVTTTAGLNTTIVNTFFQEGTFTNDSPPTSRNFTWPPLPANSIKIFGIVKQAMTDTTGFDTRNFPNGPINFKANSSSVIGNLQTDFATISTGANFLERKDYIFYEAQEGQPGEVTLFVEFLNG